MPAVDGSGKTSLRAEQAEATRRRIADAARRLFAERGYGATTLAAIAAEAGVAVQTVYAVYGSKPAILRVLRESIVRQPEAGELYAQALEATDAGERLDLFARSVRRRWERASDVVKANNDAATTDPAIRADVEAVLANRRAGIRRLAESLGPALGPGLAVDRAVAILDALTLPEVYLELTEVHGWSADEYEAWLAAAQRAQLLGG